MFRRFTQALFTFALILGATVVCMAQNGSIKGTVADSAGALIAGATVEERERDAVDCFSFEADDTGRNFKTHPLSNRRQWSHVAPADSAGSAECDLVSSPERAMVPRAVVPLKHQFRRRVLRIEIDIGEKIIARLHIERFDSPTEIVLVEASLCGRLMRACAGERGRV